MVLTTAKAKPTEGVGGLPLVCYYWLFLRVRIGSQIRGTNTGEQKERWESSFLDLHLHGKASPGWNVRGYGK